MKRIVLSVCAAVAAAVSAWAENLIVNGTFDDPGSSGGSSYLYSYQSGFACPGWTVGSGSGLAKAGSPWLDRGNAAKAGTY